MTFCHLNLHTDRSVMRGMIKPVKLVDWCVYHSVKAAAVTDYSNMSASVELYNVCKGKNVKPIYGMEVNIVDDKSIKNKSCYRVILLARNRIGFKNLLTIATIGSMYFYYMPRVDFEVIQKYSEGLTALTGDIDGIAAKAFFSNKEKGLIDLNNQWSSLFDGNFYFEIEPVPSEAQRVLNESIVKLFCDKSSGIKIVATGDPHYMNLDDRNLHENVMAIKQVRNPGWEYSMKGNYHVRTRDEMVEQFADLHGYDVSYSPGFKDSLDAPDEIIDSIERFDLREGVKIPSYISV